MLRLIGLAALVAAVPPAAAQPVAAPEACTYDLRALRIEPAFFGPRIVAGADGVPVGRLSLFGSDLSDAVVSSPRALEQARIYERSQLPAVLSIVGATVLILAASESAASGRDPGVGDVGALVGGMTLGVVGVVFSVRGQRAASRAVWEYNRDLPR